MVHPDRSHQRAPGQAPPQGKPGQLCSRPQAAPLPGSVQPPPGLRLWPPCSQPGCCTMSWGKRPPALWAAARGTEQPCGLQVTLSSRSLYTQRFTSGFTWPFCSVSLTLHLGGLAGTEGTACRELATPRVTISSAPVTPNQPRHAQPGSLCVPTFCPNHPEPAAGHPGLRESFQCVHRKPFLPRKGHETLLPTLPS